MRCSTITTAVPRSARARTRASSRLAAAGSRLASGSSRTSSRGTSISAPPIATCWPSPPDSSSVVRAISGSSAAGGSHLHQAAADLGPIDAKVLGPEGQLGRHGGGHQLAAGVLEHRPDHGGQALQRRDVRGQALDHHPTTQLAAVGVGDEPVQGTDQGRLAAARWAGHQEHFAGTDLERDVAQRRLGASLVPEREAFDDGDRIGHAGRFM